MPQVVLPVPEVRLGAQVGVEARAQPVGAAVHHRALVDAHVVAVEELALAVGQQVAHLALPALTLVAQVQHLDRVVARLLVRRQQEHPRRHAQLELHAAEWRQRPHRIEQPEAVRHAALHLRLQQVVLRLVVGEQV